MMGTGRRAGALLLGLVLARAGEPRAQTPVLVGPRVGVVVSTLEFEGLATTARLASERDYAAPEASEAEWPVSPPALAS